MYVLAPDVQRNTLVAEMNQPLLYGQSLDLQTEDQLNRIGLAGARQLRFRQIQPPVRIHQNVDLRPQHSRRSEIDALLHQRNDLQSNPHRVGLNQRRLSGRLPAMQNERSHFSR